MAKERAVQVGAETDFGEAFSNRHAIEYTGRSLGVAMICHTAHLAGAELEAGQDGHPP